MLIKLTNASTQFNGQSILINTDMVLSIYRGRQLETDGIPTDVEVTYVFMPPNGSWEVQETPEQIAELIKG